MKIALRFEYRFPSFFITLRSENRKTKNTNSEQISSMSSHFNIQQQNRSLFAFKTLSLYSLLLLASMVFFLSPLPLINSMNY